MFSILLLATTLVATTPQDSGPELAIQTGLHSWAQAIAFSPDGKHLVSGSTDRTVVLWDTVLWRQERSITSPVEWIEAVSFSPDGRLVAACGRGGVAVWETATGKLTRHISEINKAKGMMFTSGGRTILACEAGEPGLLQEWDLATGKAVRRLANGCAGPIVATPYTKYILTALNKPDRVVMMEIENGRVAAAHPNRPPPLYALAISPDGNTVAIAGGGTAKGQVPEIWNWKDGKSRFMEKGTNRFVNATGVSFSRDGRFLASTDSNTGMLGIWNLATGRVEKMLDASKGESYGAAYSPDGSLIAAGNSKGITVFTAGGFSEARRLEARIPRLVDRAISADGKRLAISGENSPVAVWDLESGLKLRTLANPPTHKAHLAISRDGTRIATGRDVNGKSEIVIWDVRTGRPLVRSTYDCLRAEFFGFSPGGDLLGFKCSNRGASVRLLDASTLETKRKLADTGALSIDWSIDGRTIIAQLPSKDMKGKANPVMSWDAASSSPPVMISENIEFGSIAASPDGGYFVWGDFGSGRMQVWEMSPPKMRWEQKLSEAEKAAGWHGIHAVAVSGDGQLVAGGDATGEIWVRRASDGRLVHAVTAHSGAVSPLSFTPDGKYLVSTGSEGRTRFSDVKTMKEVASFIWTGGEDALIATPDNYYTATKGALGAVAFTKGGRVYPFEQFDLKLNRPDLVMASLGYAPQNLITALRLARERRLKKAGFTEDMLGSDFQLPEVKITASDPQLSKKREYSFTVRATDATAPLKRLNVLMNGVPIYGSSGLPFNEVSAKTPAKDGYRVERRITVPLVAGANRLQVSVLNSKGVESLRDSMEITWDTPPVPADLYVVAIGVSAYMQKDYALKYAAKDAADISSTFNASGKGTYRAVQVLNLTDAKATGKNIVSAKDWLRKAKVDDTVVVFLAGHGMLSDELEYYFGTVDINFKKPSERGLSFEVIEDLLDGLNARRKLLMIDTCNSGEADPTEAVQVADVSKTDPRVKVRAVRGLKTAKVEGAGDGAATGELLRQVFADLRRGSGAVVLSSAGGYEFALESDKWNNGVFTFAVIEGLTTGAADKNKDGLVEVSELREYVTSRVQEMTNGLQTPAARYENLEYDFPLLKNGGDPESGLPGPGRR